LDPKVVENKTNVVQKLPGQ